MNDDGTGTSTRYRISQAREYREYRAYLQRCYAEWYIVALLENRRRPSRILDSIYLRFGLSVTSTAVFGDDVSIMNNITGRFSRELTPIVCLTFLAPN